MITKNQNYLQWTHLHHSFDSQSSSSRNRWNYDSLKNFRQISPPRSESHQTGLFDAVLCYCCFSCWSISSSIMSAFKCLTTFVATSLAFACFSAAALVARRREYLYLGGLLSSGLSILMWLHFASSVFGGSTALFKFELYFGLLVFVGYVVVDTQEIIERSQNAPILH
ncbi:hypothetical protein MtrunA17_Chr4g0055621 [Medicago truncatula]|uniref:Uncharacterized protein n=1 Tax=Medicago truncatula TaxID=3880 RepID=A0A396IC81_MEDTR|nr:hypothetical protein MtrunA17_Chr4g0055621 [Medicago truncatula]